MAHLPSAVLEPLAALLRSCILELRWPEQVMHNWLALLAKKLGGHRTIAVMCSLVRITMKLLCEDARAWDAVAALPGDTAAPGVQPVVEIAKRFLSLEVAKAQGKNSATILWDMSHFYDGIDIERLVKDVPEHDFPAVVATMALQVHVATRTLKIRDGFSPEIKGTGSGILAGCSSSTSLARLFLASPTSVAAAHPDAGTLGIHVDDVSQSFSEHSEGVLVHRAVAAGSSFAQAAVKKGLEISSKSVVVASTISVARRIAGSLRGMGFPVRAELRADDLGVGLAPGRRASSTLNKRLKLGLSRASRAAILRKAAGPVANKLFATGVLPQQSYAHAVSGLAPSQQAQVLKAANVVVGKVGLQACPVSNVWGRLGRMPVAQLLTEQLRLWTRLWSTAESRDREEIVSSWRSIRDALAPLTVKRAWQSTHGPIGATIMCLKQIGWVPAQPDYWVASDQRVASLAAEEPHAVTDILDEFSKDAHKHCWRKAAAHFLGQGLEQGIPSFDEAKAATRRLQKAATKERAERGTSALRGARSEQAFLPYGLRLTALRAVNTGGATVGSRYSPPRPCSRCSAPLETPEHRYFLCPDNSSTEMRDAEPAIARTNWIASQFSGSTARPLEQCLWGRGIVPADKCTNLRTEALDTQLQFGKFVEAATTSRTIYTDGSGGPRWVNSSLRKVGAGAASIDLQMADGQHSFHLRSMGLLFSSVPAKQSVPRAETAAGARALAQMPDGTISKWGCDALYTKQGAREPRLAARSAGANGDVWCDLSSQLKRQPGLLPHKVKAHCSLADVNSGIISFADYLGNGFADAAAGIASELFARRSCRCASRQSARPASRSS